MSVKEILTTWSEHLLCAYPSPGESLQTDTGFVTDHDFISIHKNVWRCNCNTCPLICGEFREETSALLKTVVLSFLSYMFSVRT